LDLDEPGKLKYRQLRALRHIRGAKGVLTVDLKDRAGDWCTWLGSDLASAYGALRNVQSVKVVEQAPRRSGRYANGFTVKEGEFSAFPSGLRVVFNSADTCDSDAANDGWHFELQAGGKKGRSVESVRLVEGGGWLLHPRLLAFTTAFFAGIDPCDIRLASTSKKIITIFELLQLLPADVPIVPSIQIQVEQYAGVDLRRVLADGTRLSTQDYFMVFAAVARYLTHVEACGDLGPVEFVFQDALIVRDREIRVAQNAQTTTCVLNELLRHPRFADIWEEAPIGYDGPVIRFEYPNKAECPVCPVGYLQTCYKHSHKLHWLSHRDPDMANRRFRPRKA
jgi:hypothetical protein